MPHNVFNFAETQTPTGNAVIKVFGIGGGGGNAVEHMVNSQLTGVEFICANTDMQALRKMHADVHLPLGQNTTQGLGAGANPEKGRQAAIEDRERIRDVLDGADMVFVTAGMGGGTGTGGAPVVAEIAQEMNILTIGMVTTPFGFEGHRRIKVAEEGIESLSQYVDSLITIPNQRLLEVLGKVTLQEAFRVANNVLRNAVEGISNMISQPGLINVDFADVRTVMSIKGLAMMGAGSAKGEDRARLATEQAIHSPLLNDVSLAGAKGVLVSVAANEDLGLQEFTTVGDIVHGFAAPDATVVVGTVLDPSLGDEIRVTVVATGLVRTVQTSSQPNVRVVANNPQTAAQTQPIPARATGTHGGLPYGHDFDKPAYERKAEAIATGTAPAAARSVKLMDIPSFLKEQFD